MNEKDQYTDERRLQEFVGELAHRADNYLKERNVAGMTLLADNAPKDVNARGAAAVASAMASERAGRHGDGHPARDAWTRVSVAYAKKADLDQAKQPKD